MTPLFIRAAVRSLICVLLTGTAVPLQAQAFRAPPTESYALPNGLRVILSPDRSSQVVTVNVWYDVGSRSERAGRTGFAHLFEHMMFQGSAHVAKGDHLSLVQRSGGVVNASTAEDRTNFFQTLPSNRLNLGLWLEAERMRALRITTEHLDNQRETVKEERRLRIDNQPYMGAYYRAVAEVFDRERCFAYAHETVGSMDDLNAATLDDVIDFHRTYYRPNNATLVVVGDFAPAEAKALISRYFRDIPRGPAPPPVACDQPFHAGPQRRTIGDARAALPAVLIIWRTPDYAHADWPALDLLSAVVGRGASSRLHRAVVRDARAAVATQAFAGLGAPRRGPGVFGILGVTNQGVPADSVEKLLLQEVARVTAQGTSAPELTKAQNAHRATRFAQLETSLGRSEALQIAQLYLGDAAAVTRDVERYQAVTLDDLRRVAATWLTPANRTIVTITPESRTP